VPLSQTSPPVGRGTPPPHTLPLRRLDPRAYGARTRRLRRLVLSVSLPLILQFDHWLGCWFNVLYLSRFMFSSAVFVLCFNC